jgi:hypothetical protein
LAIGLVRIVNAFVSTVNAGIAAVALSSPWDVVVPLAVGGIAQAVAEAYNVLSGKP